MTANHVLKYLMLNSPLDEPGQCDARYNWPEIIHDIVTAALAGRRRYELPIASLRHPALSRYELSLLAEYTRLAQLEEIRTYVQTSSSRPTPQEPIYHTALVFEW